MIYNKILEIHGQKMVQRFPRPMGVTQEFYRFTSELNILRLLADYQIQAPRVIGHSEESIIEEYIDGDLVKALFPDHTPISHFIIDSTIQNMEDLLSIPISTIDDYILWNDSREFFEFQVYNSKKVVTCYEKTLKGLYEQLGLTSQSLDIVLPLKSLINTERPLVLIHGDRHKGNMILKEKTLIFIDWELGGIGDIVYDMAFHLHQMAYTEEDEEYCYSKLLEKKSLFQFSKDELEVYRLFILLRSTLYHIYWTYLAYHNDAIWKKNQLGHFMRRYNKIAATGIFGVTEKSEKELHYLFNNYCEKEPYNSYLKRQV